MTTSFNKLSPAELERLAILAEEASEVIKVVNKIIRHGWDSTHPDPTRYSGQNNRQRLENEIGDLQCILVRMMDDKDISLGEVFRHRDAKRKSAHLWMHHN